MGKSESTGREIDRRRLIKRAAMGATAVGVGAVAWSSPSITRLGNTPAYGATCTAPFTTITSNADGNVNCGGLCNSLRWANPPTFNNGFTVAFVPNVCADSQRAVAINSPGFECFVDSVTVFFGPACGGSLTEGGGDVKFLPALDPIASNCCASSKWQLVLNCVPEGTTCVP